MINRTINNGFWACVLPFWWWILVNSGKAKTV